MDAYLTNKDMGFLFTWMWGIGLIHSIGVNKGLIHSIGVNKHHLQ